MQNRREIATGFLERMADPGYRLIGENPATATVDRARHWAAIYEQLVQFKSELLALCQRYIEHSEPEVSRAIRETDMIMLETQISRFRQKRDYWKIRAAELPGNGRHAEPD